MIGFSPAVLGATAGKISLSARRFENFLCVAWVNSLAHSWVVNTSRLGGCESGRQSIVLKQSD
jgi:hypothetical protein